MQSNTVSLQQKQQDYDNKRETKNWSPHMVVNLQK